MKDLDDSQPSSRTGLPVSRRVRDHRDGQRRRRPEDKRAAKSSKGSASACSPASCACVRRAKAITCRSRSVSPARVARSTTRRTRRCGQRSGHPLDAVRSGNRESGIRESEKQLDGCMAASLTESPIPIPAVPAQPLVRPPRPPALRTGVARDAGFTERAAPTRRRTVAGRARSGVHPRPGRQAGARAGAGRHPGRSTSIAAAR